MRSTISLTPNQRALILEFVSIIDRFQAQDPTFIKEGLQKAREILSDPSRVHALMSKAKDNSPQADQIPVEETKRIVLESFPKEGDFEASELLVYIQNLSGKRISSSHLRNVLGELATEEKVNFREYKNRKYWSLVA